MASDHAGTVPTWDGQPRSWRRCTKEVSWYVASTPTSKRRYVASRLIGKLTGSARLLAMSWNRAEFDNVNGTLMLLRKLAASPLVRRTLPNTAAIMQQYLGFKRRSGETMANFLVRETLGYEEFSEALVRLWEEQSGILPEEMNFGLPEVRAEEAWDGWRWWHYDGWQDWSQHDGSPEEPQHEAEEAAEAPSGTTPVRGSMGSSPSATREERPASEPGQPRAPSMASASVQADQQLGGLNELSLADSFIMQVLRRWRLLQAASLSPEETRDILSTTQNKMTFEAISGALQTLSNEQLLGHRYQPWRNGMSLHWMDHGQAWEEDDWSWQEPDGHDDYYGYFQDWSGWSDEAWHADVVEEMAFLRTMSNSRRPSRPRRQQSRWLWRPNAHGLKLRG